MECKKDKNKIDCASKSDTCERKGVCCECVAYHRAKDQLPTCLRHLVK